jgi:hypothetical protein
MSEWKLGDPNKSLNYVLPMLGINYKQFRDLTFPKSQFVNVFVGDDSIGLENCILLLYKYSSKEEFDKLDEELRQHPEFDHTYEPDKYHTMFVFNIPLKYIEDFGKFIDGKYSQFTEEYKKHILKFNESNLTEGVLYKRESEFKELEKKLGISIPRDQEASSKPYRIKEYYQESYKKQSALKPNTNFYNESTSKENNDETVIS